MRNQIKYSCIIFLAALSYQGVAQERTKDTLNPEVVNIVKPYTPTISDAFKVKESPTLNDATTSAKKEVKYNIFSIPVASTFTPAKGKAATVNKSKPIKLYDNYASLAAGSYTTILGEVNLNYTLDRGETVGAYLSHHSSSGGIKDLLLDDDFMNTKLNLNYNKKTNDLSWGVDGGVHYQSYNWYGLPQPFFDETFASNLDVKHSYLGADLGGKIKLEDHWFNGANVRFKHFGDDQGSGENRFMFKGEIELPLQDEDISVELSMDYLTGEFDRNYFSNDPLKYSNFIFGIAPRYQMTQDDFTIDLGVKLMYLNDNENGASKLYIYPNITASYRLIDELLIAYGAIQGGLLQNTYEEFVDGNSFLSPTLDMFTTDQKFKATAGIKGKLTNDVSYSVAANYSAEGRKALYKANSIWGGATEDYQHGNSFGIVYDDVSTISLAGELAVDLNRSLRVGLKGEYFTYSTDNESEAWNLPELKASLMAEYLIDEKWSAGAGIFFVGERKDQFVNETISPAFSETKTIKSYFDLNAHLAYKVNDRFSLFAKANNIANQRYERWLNYPVQGIQLLAGGSYQFDF